MNGLFDNDVIVSTLKAWFKPGDVFEIRILEALTKRWNTKRHTESGYFDYEHIDDIPSALGAILDYRGVYVTINPLQPAALGRSANRFKSDKLIGAKDEEVLRRQGILIDCDAKRLSGVSSSDEEHNSALAKADDIAQGLSTMGWPEPIRIDSGNGAQLLYRVDLPTQDGGLVKRCLEALLPCSDEYVDIDQTVFNSARLWRLPGTQNRKGDELPSQTRVYRMSTVRSLPELSPVSQEALDALAEKSPAQQPSVSWSFDNAFDIDGFVSRHFPGAKAEPYGGGRKWVLDVCPFNSDHNNRSAMIRQSADGKLGFVCHHHGCFGKNWHDLRALLEPKVELPPVDFSHITVNGQPVGLPLEASAPQAPDVTPKTPTLVIPKPSIERYAPNDMIEEFKEEPPVIVEGILREQETMNIIAAPKTGKSWFVLQLAISIALGRKWLKHECTPKRVLLVDNELHKATLAHRLKIVCQAMGVHPVELKDKLWINPQRGNIRSIVDLKPILPDLVEQGYGVIIIDAFYRALPREVDENSNGDIKAIYNLIDSYAMTTNTAFILVHHTTKGNQSEKSTTDIGAGAGSQSRAADTHMVMLHHMEKKAVVIRSVNRSFPEQEPFCLRLNFPLWQRADDLNPRLLEGLSPRDIKAILKEDGVIEDEVLPDPLDELKKVAAVLSKHGGACGKTTLRDKVMAELELGQKTAERKIKEAVAAGLIKTREERVGPRKVRMCLHFLPESSAAEQSTASVKSSEEPVATEEPDDLYSELE